jgi:hypothetical protein
MIPPISVTMAAQNCTSRVTVLRCFRWCLPETCGFWRFLLRFLCEITKTSFHGGNYPHPLPRARVSPFVQIFPTLWGQPTTLQKLRPKHNTILSASSYRLCHSLGFVLEFGFWVFWFFVSAVSFYIFSRSLSVSPVAVLICSFVSPAVFRFRAISSLVFCSLRLFARPAPPRV